MTANSLQASVNLLRSSLSKLNVRSGETCGPGLQRRVSVATNDGFLESDHPAWFKNCRFRVTQARPILPIDPRIYRSDAHCMSAVPYVMANTAYVSFVGGYACRESHGSDLSISSSVRLGPAPISSTIWIPHCKVQGSTSYAEHTASPCQRYCPSKNSCCFMQHPP